MPKTTPVSCTTLLLALALTGLGCVDRQAEPDYSEIIQDSCEVSCPISTGCGPNPLYDSVEECVQMCSTSEVWDELDECDTRSIEFSNCVGTLSCEEYQAYLELLDQGASFTTENFKCAEELDATYSCNPNNPFEEPQ